MFVYFWVQSVCSCAADWGYDEWLWVLLKVWCSTTPWCLTFCECEWVCVCVRCLTYNKYVLILVSYSKSMVKVNPYKYLHRWTEISKCDLCVCGMSSGIFTELFCCIFLTSWFIPFSLNIVYIQFYLFFWPESLPIPRRQKEQWRYEPRGHLTDG